MASVSAQNKEWHGRLILSEGNNRISASGRWVFDPGRAAIGPGGNGTLANNDDDRGAFPLADGHAMEGALLARVNGGGITAFGGSDQNHIVLTGHGYVEFKMNDNNYFDNSGALEVTVEHVS